MQRKLRLVDDSDSLTPGRPSALDRVMSEALEWDGVQIGVHRFGGYEFTYRGAELGHVSSDGILDLSFPAAMRERLVAKGWVDLHHILPMSGWVTFRIECHDDVDHAVRLLRIAYRRRRLLIARLKVH